MNTFSSRLRLAAILSACVAAATRAHGQIIDFETIPGGTPVDGMTIDTQFLADFGVTFSLEGGGAPVLAQVGAPRTAFQGYNNLPDQPAPGVPAGQFFLTDDGVLSGPPTPLIISYVSPVAEAGGIIIDIDGAEAFDVQARDAIGNVLEFVHLGPNNLLDGSGTSWSFARATNDIYSIRIVYTGTQTGGVGLAFDRFTPTTASPVPEPTTLCLMAMAGIAALRAKHRTQTT